jgi:uncharacterized protein (DUF2345 family)
VAYHGCKTACGAVLISSQMVTLTEPSGGAGQGAARSAAADAPAKGVGSIGSGAAARYQDEALDETRKRYRGRFQVLDQASGEPIAGESVRVRSTGGQYLTGTTDAEGFTQWVEREASEALAFDLVERGQA